MFDQKTLKELIKDSALVLTVIAVVLYTWGFFADLDVMIILGVPFDFIPERPIQTYILLGGFIAVFFYVPVILSIVLIYKLLKLMSKGRINIGRLIPIKWDATNMIILVLFFLMLSVFILRPLSKYIVQANKDRSPRVKSITFSSESKITNKYEGLYFVTKKGVNYIFIDKPAEKDATTFIVHEDEVKEVVLENTTQ